MKNSIDKASFALGMTGAFCECVANEAKALALSPPVSLELANEIDDDIKEIVDDFGLKMHRDMYVSHDTTIVWNIIYKFQCQFDEYMKIKNRGLSPISDFPEFKRILGYGLAFCDGSQNLNPKIIEDPKHSSIIGNILD